MEHESISCSISFKQQYSLKIATCYFSRNFPRGASGLHVCDARMQAGKGGTSYPAAFTQILFQISGQFDHQTHH